MKPFTLALRAAPQQRIDLSCIAPHRLTEIDGNTQVHTSKESLALGDLFKIERGDPASIRLIGGLDVFDGVGTAMSEGTLLIEGDAGARLGHGLKGGAISVSGHAGVWCGAGMSKGRITVGKSAGQWLGGALPGELAGMSGGLIHVKGDAGPEAGLRMRRGVIAVGGTAGDYAGREMIAGTLIISGSAARRAGYGMKRGTIVIGGKAELTSTFLDCGIADLAFLKLLGRSLADQGIATRRLLRLPLRRFAGDTAVLGKGEIFL